MAGSLDVDPEQGLSQAEAIRRLVEDGPNETDPPERPSLLKGVWEAVTQPFVLMLFVAGILAIVLGEVRDGLLVLAGLVPIVGADVATSYRAERALEALRAASAPRARIRRDGQPIEIHARETVVGDILLLSTGDVVPADARVLFAHGALVDRSVLTGESLPEPLAVTPDPVGASLPERRSMVYAGTSVVGGTAEAVVVAIGPDTEVGRISGALGSARPTPLPDPGGAPPAGSPAPRRRRGAGCDHGRFRLSARQSVGHDPRCGHRGSDRGDSGGAPRAPRGHPRVGSLSAPGRGVLVRRLNAQETLGAVDLILTDKTGTLTRNRLEVASVWTPDGVVPPGADRARLLVDALRAETDAWQAARLGAAGAFPNAIRRALEADGVDAELDVGDLIGCEPAAEGHPYSMVVFRTGGGSSLACERRTGGDPGAGGGTNSREATEWWRRLVAEEAGRGSRLLLLATRDERRCVAALGAARLPGSTAAGDRRRHVRRRERRHPDRHGHRRSPVDGRHHCRRGGPAPGSSGHRRRPGRRGTIASLRRSCPSCGSWPGQLRTTSCAWSTPAA